MVSKSVPGLGDPKGKDCPQGQCAVCKKLWGSAMEACPLPEPMLPSRPQGGAATVELPGLRDHSTGHLACPHFLPDLGSAHIGIKYSPQLPSLGQPAPSTSQVHAHRPAGHHSDSECRPP